MRIHCLQSAENEGPGVIADWAAGRGFPVETTRLFAGEPLPDPHAFDLLLVMGGPMNIYQDRDFPWLKATRRFIAGHVKSGRPAIGICLGSQFLADALGGRVTQNPHHEIGWHAVRFSGEARRLIPFLPESHDVMHWHGDTFELPEGAVRLGSSKACENQGFLFESRVLALQFHPEMTREIAAALVADESPEACGHVQSGEAILARPDADFAKAHELLRGMLDGLFVSR